MSVLVMEGNSCNALERPLLKNTNFHEEHQASASAANTDLSFAVWLFTLVSSCSGASFLWYEGGGGPGGRMWSNADLLPINDVLNYGSSRLLPVLNEIGHSKMVLIPSQTTCVLQ